MSPLDNPMWNSLMSRHAHLALGAGLARRYPPAVTPFAGVADSSPEAESELRSIVAVGESVGLLNVYPEFADGWSVVKRLSIYQYVFQSGISCQGSGISYQGSRISGEESGTRDQGSVVRGQGSVPDEGAVLLGDEHVDRMIDLTTLVYPAYFRRETAKLGAYFGFMEGDRLCAMAGVRMSLEGFQEISAVCTHPDYRGRGYAKRLTRHLVHHIQAASDVPFLHTESDNTVAQGIYESLGFTLRRVLPFCVVERTESRRA